MRFYIIIILFSCLRCTTVDPYENEIMEWRTERINKLTAPIGWASLSGLHWISNDTTSIGGPGTDIIFSDDIQGSLAQIIKHGEELHFENPAEGVVADNEQEAKGLIRTDQDESPGRYKFKNWEWTFIERGGKTGLRLWDTTNVNRTKFLELDYYPIDPDYKLEAQYFPYDTPVERPIRNVLGMSIPYTIPGELRFELDGKQFSLQVLNGTDEEFFIIFADETTGGDTYGGGRYLYSPKPEKGTKSCTIDFNKAYTPPCGFTEFATCLLPTTDNTLRIEIKAGERYHFDH